MKRMTRLALFLTVAMGVSFNLMAQKPADLLRKTIRLLTSWRGNQKTVTKPNEGLYDSHSYLTRSAESGPGRQELL
jgi:hypothetical protein